MMEEIRTLKNGTQDVTELLKGKLTIGCKGIFTIKYKVDGTIKGYKARLVAKRFVQIYGIDFIEIFAPVVKLNTVWVLLSLAKNLTRPLQQLDKK